MTKKPIDSRTVVSPKASIRNLHVVFDGGLWDEANPDWSGWSLSMLQWDGSPAVGVRWNGEMGVSVGSPQSRGLPTWFIMPQPLAGLCLDRVSEHLRGGTGEGAAEAIPPRRRLLDLIAFVRAASDEELKQMLDQMGLQTARAA
jgi:hypothetical protein